MSGEELTNVLTQFRDTLDEDTRYFFKRGGELISDLMTECYDNISKEDFAIFMALMMMCLTIGKEEPDE